MAKHWIQGAVKRPGALTAKAQAAGMGTQEFASKHAGDSGLTGQQARFAKTISKFDQGGMVKGGSPAVSAPCGDTKTLKCYK